MERVSREALEDFFRRMGCTCRVVEVRELGSGAHGTGYLVRTESVEGTKRYVLKSVTPEGLGHDYPSDRAAMHLLALETFNTLSCHVKAIDVLSLHPDGSLHGIGGGRDYFLLMEHVEGVHYFDDLARMAGKEKLDVRDRERIGMLARVMAEIHGEKKDSRTLYLRKLRDNVGHGECLMGVFDLYPDGTLPADEMAAIEKKCIDWRYRLRKRYHRLSRVHGDYHPGNLWFTQDPEGEDRLTLLDRSRGPWGEPADDVTALTINYVFYSIIHFNCMQAPYDEALRLFYDNYLRLTGDRDVLEVVAPFYAFRGAVVSNPLFYPQVTPEQRELIFRFVNRVLDEPVFDPSGTEEYISP